MNLFNLFATLTLDDSEYTKSVSSASGSATSLGSTFESVGNKIKAALTFTAVVAGFTKVITYSDDLQKAQNNLQAQTGATNDEMEALNDTMLNIYNNNFGEDFEDIANQMAIVTQQTGATGDELEQLTTKALILRDTFGYEVTDSIRSVEMLMGQFGVTSDEAFNLLAQGAQSGLDANGNLLDSINEYSVHFADLGFDIEDMFNMLANGADAGVFDIDKLGDAMKEFGIRTKDESDTSAAAFESLGLNADEYFSKFAQGGDSAQEASQTVFDALTSMEDPLEQNTVGVALFGTMWEDLGVDAITALTNTQGEIDATKDTLDEINDVKYDSVGEAFEGIKRNLETGILLPLGESVLPKLQEFGDYLNDNMPEILETVTVFIDGFSAAIGFLYDNSETIIPILVGVVAAFTAFKIIGDITALMTAYKAITETMTIAQWLLNAAMTANPIGIVVALIAGLIAALVYLWNTNEGFRDFIINMFVAIGDAITSFVDGVVKFFTETIPEALQKLNSNFKAWVDNIISSLIGWLSGLWQAGVTFVTNLWSGVSSMVSTMTTNVRNFVNSVISTVKDLLSGSTLLSVGKNLIYGLWNGISNVTTWLYDKISGFVGGVTDKIKSLFGIQSPSTLFRDEVGKFLGQGVGVGFVDSMDDVSKDMENAIPTVYDLEPTINSSLAVNSTSSTQNVSSKLDELIEAFKGHSQDIYMDATKVGSTVASGVYKKMTSDYNATRKVVGA
ncbi:MAG: phage tail tape measure protein [Clostridia bacterium]